MNYSYIYIIIKSTKYSCVECSIQGNVTNLYFIGGETFMDIPQKFLDYIAEPVKREIDYKKVSKFDFYLSQEKAKEDFEYFKYIMDNAYSGKDYFEKLGINFNDNYKKIEAYIQSCEKIDKDDLCTAYYNAFKGIHDGHLAFISSNLGWASFQKKYSAYFSDIILEKQKNNYIVAQSKIDIIKIGETVICSDENLFETFSPQGKSLYLYGIRSWEEIENIKINISNRFISIPVHKCKASLYLSTVKEHFSSVDIDGISVLETPTFSFGSGYDESIAQELLLQGEKLKNVEIVIWNLLSNGGGASNYPMSFIKGLNDYSHWEINMGMLQSPVITQSTENENQIFFRDWKFFLSEPYDLSNAKYDGTLFVLINSNVASSGEAAVAYSTSVIKRIFIGENTAGCGTFGDTFTYQLPYSEMKMKVPFKIFLGMGKEGEGFTPDFWVDNEDVQSETIRWINNPETYMPYQSE